MRGAGRGTTTKAARLALHIQFNEHDVGYDMMEL